MAKFHDAHHKHFFVSADGEAKSSADKSKKCRETFMKCRKYQDEAGRLKHACGRMKQQQLQKLNSLDKNVKALNKFSSDVKAKTGASARKVDKRSSGPNWVSFSKIV